MSLSLPKLPFAVQPLEGPSHHAGELRWSLRLEDGRSATLCQLLPELAEEESLRRRYVRDQERLRSLQSPHLPQVLALGPQPDPRAPGASPPWRLSIDPQLETLEAWLQRRAPAPADEACQRIARIADALHTLHAQGLVVANLHPLQVQMNDDALFFVNVGLHRTDILSSRTAQSLLLQSSPYAAPERLVQTKLDQRADIYSLGIMLWRALTGALPFEGLNLGAHPALPSLRALRPELPEALERLVERLLQPEPEKRPASAAELAALLRGEPLPGLEAQSRCQRCLASLFLGQRLCLSCGHQAVQLEQLQYEPEAEDIYLMSASEDASFMEHLRQLLEPAIEGEVQQLEFIVGDARLYSPEEQLTRIKLPVRLLTRLSPSSAELMQKRLREGGFKIKRSSELRTQRWRLVGLLALTGGALLMAPLLLHEVLGLWSLLLVFLGLMSSLFTIFGHQALKRKEDAPALGFRLRKAPIALPASDPLVARLASALEEDAAEDLRAQLGELALRIQRLVDHKAQLEGAEHQELELLTQPIEPLVALIEQETQQLQRIDKALSELDEGKLVRALSRSKARGEPAEVREALLLKLDELRTLEDDRAQAFHRLLEAGRLLRRSVEMGLSIKDEREEGYAYQRDLALARAALQA